MEVEPGVYTEINHLQMRDAVEILQEIVTDGIQFQVRQVLDLGSGSGNVTRMIAKVLPNAKILGIDILPSMVNFSNAQLTLEESSRIDFLVQDFCAEFKEWNEKLRKLEGKVDLIFSTYALHYAPLEKRQEIINYLVRLLSPGGRLYINFCVFRDFLPFMPPELQEKNRELIRIPTVAKQRETLREYFKAHESMTSISVHVEERVGSGPRDDKLLNSFRRGQIFINVYRPFIVQELSEETKDNVLNSCVDYAFSPFIEECCDGLRMFYECAQIRGYKLGLKNHINE